MMNTITRINEPRTGSLAVLPSGRGAVLLHPAWEARAPPTVRVSVTKDRIVAIMQWWPSRIREGHRRLQ